MQKFEIIEAEGSLSAFGDNMVLHFFGTTGEGTHRRFSSLPEITRDH